ncbi:protein CURLY FLAG LEAF 2 [Magnolia sinica]|uniref:protein CURLY FLAG LEAF 2 n=1 Tax=Magnolia sinica TaxID=86752 RepID=UPI00265A42D4|nr:protein CURLY FLAG LEAF 2 [Magnolia sinica]
MAADVSSLVRILNGYKEEQHQQQMQGGGESTVLITRDLLGGCSVIGSKELDLDLQVPNGWEKRLDLKSGKIYLQRCDSPISPSDKRSTAGFQDLNYPPNLLEDTSLDLKLVPSIESQSVCTLDKVKSALERAQRESTKKRSVATYGSSERSSSRVHSSLSSPSSQSSMSIKGGDEEGETEGEKEMKSSPLVFAAGCPGCLLYVLISKANPRCPRCRTVVPVPVPVPKKLRIDLNVSM